MSTKSWSWKVPQLVLEKNKLQNSSFFSLNLKGQLVLAWAQSCPSSLPQVSPSAAWGAHTDWGGHLRSLFTALFIYLHKTAAEELPKLHRNEPITSLCTLPAVFPLFDASLTLLSSSSEPFLMKQEIVNSLYVKQKQVWRLPNTRFSIQLSGQGVAWL